MSALELARVNVVPILTDRHNGMSCRAIAEKYDLPEHAIWGIMQETGNAGKHRAKPRPSRRQRRTHDWTLADIENHADEIVLERSADGEGWIATIDDLTGEQALTIKGAILSAHERWGAR